MGTPREDIDKIIDVIADMRYKKGMTQFNIIKFIQKEYNYGQTRSYEIYKLMLQKIGKVYKRSEECLEDAISFLEEMKQRNVAKDNDRLALEVQKELNKLLELANNNIQEINSDKIVININGNKPGPNNPTE